MWQSPANPQPSLTLQTSTGLVAAPVVTAVQTQAAITTPTKQVIQIRPAPQVTQIRLQPVNTTPGSNNALQRKGLSLTVSENVPSIGIVFWTANIIVLWPAFSIFMCRYHAVHMWLHLKPQVFGQTLLPAERDFFNNKWFCLLVY